MKITIISDNSIFNPELEAEFGLSILLERGDAKILFDCGNRDACINNARKLGIDLSALTAIAFSHNHRDHCGGFIRIAKEIKPACPVYARSGFFRRKWWDHRFDPPGQPTHCEYLEFVGPPMTADFFFQNGIDSFRLVDEDVVEITDGIYLVGNFPENAPGEEIHPSSAMENADGTFSLDSFWDEQVCVARCPRGLVLLAGCAHNGIMNIINTVYSRFPGEKIIAVLGGTHLVPPDESRISRTVDFFSKAGFECSGVCHCTGSIALSCFESQVPSFVMAGSGYTWESS